MLFVCLFIPPPQSSPFPVLLLSQPRCCRCEPRDAQGPPYLISLKVRAKGMRPKSPLSLLFPFAFPPFLELFFSHLYWGSALQLSKGLRLLPRHDPPSPRPRSSAAGAGCAPGAHKSTACSQNLATMNPGSLLNQEKNCVGFPSATLRVLHSSTSRTPE